LLIERHGDVRLYSPITKQLKTIATIPVSTKYKDKEGNETEAEDGLLGVNIDPNFAQNHWIYLYYSPAGPEPKNILTRYELKGDELVLSSKKILLEVPVQREQCCHTGGSIDWDRQGNLYLSTGDNTSPRATLYAPIDEREGRGPWDAQKSSGNTNDLRGKIIRIHPEADGTYTIPEGNLFAKGTDPSDRPKTRSEIYTMGHRNPYRISVDKHTGYLYWGDVGPDAGVDSAGVGPTAEDEYNQARQAGNFGWPYFVGANKAYYDVDFASGKKGAQFDPAHPFNDSPNNTGLRDLPPAQPALISYPASGSKKFPIMGTGGRSAMAGPAYYKDDLKDAKRPFPDYYNGKVFFYEWMRDMILSVSFNDKGDMTNIERFLPNMALSHPIDMAFGPNGDLYVLEYGTGWFTKNDDSRLVRIEYNAGNRKPAVQVAANQTAGAVPLKVILSSEGTKDFDNDVLTYQWKIFAKGSAQPTVLNEANPAFTFQKPGQYKAILTVTDAKGLSDSRELNIVAGNQPPVVAVNIVQANKSFYFPGQPITYQVSVTDKEDGSLARLSTSPGQINPKQVVVRATYGEETPAQNASEADRGPAGHKFSEATYLGNGKVLMEKSDCKACHFTDKKSVGPAFADVAKRYKGDANAVASLSNKIIKGGGGVWGDAIMTAHPQLASADAGEIVKYILTMSDKPVTAPLLPTKGTITPAKDQQGNLVLQAYYTDKGAKGLPAQTTQQALVLRNPVLTMGFSDSQSKGTMIFKMGQSPIVIVQASDTYVRFNKLDLTGIKAMEFTVAAPKAQLNATGGRIEVRIDSPTGQLLGQSDEIKPSEVEVKSVADAFKPSTVKTSITPVTGAHDLYFVFKNEKAGKAPLFVPISVQLFN
jgi:cytochrome c